MCNMIYSSEKFVERSFRGSRPPEGERCSISPKQPNGISSAGHKTILFFDYPVVGTIVTNGFVTGGLKNISAHGVVVG